MPARYLGFNQSFLRVSVYCDGLRNKNFGLGQSPQYYLGRNLQGFGANESSKRTKPLFTATLMASVRPVTFSFSRM